MFELAPTCVVGTSPSYQVDNSLRFNSADTAYLSRTFASGNRKTWTWSGWVKKSSNGAYQTIFGQGTGTAASGYGFFRFDAGDTFTFSASPDGGTSSITWTSTAVFRDNAAHYHLIIVLDTTQATGSNRLKVYINGVLIAGTFATPPTQNADIEINRAAAHQIGAANASSVTNYLNGYLSEINFIDGQALSPTDFGKIDSVTGQWIPKKYNGSYGTNGFYLPFDDGTSTTTLGYDRSGNANNWTLNNFTRSAGVNDDWFEDSPTNNYCTLNPLQTGAYVTTLDGNLKVSGNTTANSALSLCTFAELTSGLWYVEYTQGTVQSETCGVTTQNMSGVSLINGENIGAYGIGARANGTVFGGTVGSITSWTTGDIIGIAIDCDNGAVYWRKNGTWLNGGNPTSGGSKTGAVGVWTPSPTKVITPAFGAYNTGFVNVNFGQRAFAYTPPTGFASLCAANLPTPAIEQPSEYFDINLSAATGATRSITGVAFQPDLVISKNRSYSTNGRWGYIDAARGVNKTLCSNLTGAEVSQSDLLTSFNADGFTLGADASAYGWNYNQGGNSVYAYWMWKAGNGTVSNTDGSITSTVSANPTAGFSIVTYTGTGANATVGHGLGVAPKMVLSKSRNNAGVESGNWFVWHESAGTGNWLRLNTTDAAADIAASGGGTMVAPTTSVFTTAYISGSGIAANNYVAYCFAEVPGYSKFGKYTGNGSADGPFVYCGFKPKFVMIKRTDTTGDWIIWDTARDTYNVMNDSLSANLSDAEKAGTTNVDFVSNGFKPRFASTNWNASGGTYIFMAFAEAPMKYSTGR